MGTSDSDIKRLRDLPQASSNDSIKAYVSLGVKLSEMSEFSANYIYNIYII